MLEIAVGLLITGMVVFAVWSAVREIQTYRKYLGGDKQYLVSKKRRNRRVFVSIVLIVESVLLFVGIYVVEFNNPSQALIYWIVPTGLIFAIVYLGMKDFQETSRDLDILVREASDVILRKKNE